MKVPTTRVFVMGGYGFHNFGDDCLMIACHELLKRTLSNSDYTFLCRDLDYPQKLISGVQVISSNIKSDLMCELLLYGGGTQFYSFKKTISEYLKKGFSAISNPVKTIARIRSIYSLKYSVHCTYSAAIGVGFGPFVPGSVAIERAEKIAKNLDYLSVRDVVSESLCRQWGLQSFSVYTDLCFWPHLRELFEIETSHIPKRSLHSMGIIVRDWPHDKIGDAYTEQVFEVAGRLQSQGVKVYFILFAGSDVIWTSRIGDKFPVMKWDPMKFTVANFLGSLRQFDLLMTARYHGAIFASLLGIPFISIGIEPKLSMVAQLLGVGEYIWRFPYDVDVCMKLIELAVDHHDEIQQAMELSVATQSQLSAKMISEFTTFLHSKELKTLKE